MELNELNERQWQRVSHILDYIRSYPTGGAVAVTGEVQKPKRKQKKAKDTNASKIEQLRLI